MTDTDFGRQVGVWFNAIFAAVNLTAYVEGSGLWLSLFVGILNGLLAIAYGASPLKQRAGAQKAAAR